MYIKNPGGDSVHAVCNTSLCSIGSNVVSCWGWGGKHGFSNNVSSQLDLFVFSPIAASRDELLVDQSGLWNPGAEMDSSLVEGGLNVTLTIRLLMHGKVGAVTWNRFRPRT